MCALVLEPVGKLIVQGMDDAETICRLNKEKNELSTKFQQQLEERERLVMAKEDAETRSLRIVQSRALIQVEADRVPVLVDNLRIKNEECQRL